jgi:hypothetical protein
MQDRPDKTELLGGVARFLLQDVHPRIEAQDKGLAFRVLIAANLLQIVSAEVRTEEAHDAAQLARLRALLPESDQTAQADGAPLDAEGRRRRIVELERALCARLRRPDLPEEERAAALRHVKETLREKLQVVNPRFDTAAEIE